MKEPRSEEEKKGMERDRDRDTERETCRKRVKETYTQRKSNQQVTGMTTVSKATDSLAGSSLEQVGIG